MHAGEGFSIIIPTFQEAKNIPILVNNIAALDLSKIPFEVILVDDDSQDGTTEIIEQLREMYPWLTLFVRSRHLGPSWAQSILKGIELASYPILIFMDADLSHSPENIPEMLALLQQSNNIEMVIGSRYMAGGIIDEKWPIYRVLISRLATWMIRPLLPAAIKDPLSGFIAIRKNIYLRQGKSWNPIGTKLGLEIIVKSQIKNIREVPIYFRQRQHGKSKLIGIQTAWLYIKQIIRLWQHKLYSHSLR